MFFSVQYGYGYNMPEDQKNEYDQNPSHSIKDTEKNTEINQKEFSLINS